MPSAVRSDFTLHRRVHFHEVDSAGIVHFSAYFRYMEEAEHALWRAAGLSIAARGSDLAFPRVATSFDYEQPLRFEDECEVEIRIVALGRSSIRYACTITRGADRIAAGNLTVVCVRKAADGRMRSHALPDEIRSRFAVAAEGAAT